MLPDDAPVIENAAPGTLSSPASEVESCDTNCAIRVCDVKIELKSASNENDAYIRYVVVVVLCAVVFAAVVADGDWLDVGTAVVTGAVDEDDGTAVVTGALPVVEAA